MISATGSKILKLTPCCCPCPNHRVPEKNSWGVEDLFSALELPKRNCQHVFGSQLKETRYLFFLPANFSRVCVAFRPFLFGAAAWQHGNPFWVSMVNLFFFLVFARGK